MTWRRVEAAFTDLTDLIDLKDSFFAMDILSHGLWAGAAARAAKQKKQIPIRYRNAFFWGMFPDLFAFTPIFVIGIVTLLLTGAPPAFPRPEHAEPAPPSLNTVAHFTHHLYALSHSIIIFTAVFSLILLVTKKKPWAMGGWLLHILMDIPTHSYRFYPTPFLWPISSYTYNGFSWSQAWFMILNYSTLALIYLWLWKNNTHLSSSEKPR